MSIMNFVTIDIFSISLLLLQKTLICMEKETEQALVREAQFITSSIDFSKNTILRRLEILSALLLSKECVSLCFHVKGVVAVTPDLHSP